MTLPKCMKSSSSRQLQHFSIQPSELSPLTRLAHSKQRQLCPTHCSVRHGWKCQYRPLSSLELSTALISSRRVFSQSIQSTDIEAKLEIMVLMKATINKIMISSPNLDYLKMVPLLRLNPTLRTTLMSTNLDHSLRLSSLTVWLMAVLLIKTLPQSGKLRGQARMLMICFGPLVRYMVSRISHSLTKIRSSHPEVTLSSSRAW